MVSLDEIVDDNELLKKATKMALEASEQAVTFGSKVGYVVQTYDGKLFSGFNIELYIYESIHAEKNAMLAAMKEGYRFTDFKRLIGIFKEVRASKNSNQNAPVSCFACLGFMYDIAHPYIELIKVNTKGEEVYRTRLNKIIAAKDAEVYPTTTTRELKKRINNTPKLPLATELKEFYVKDEKFKRLCDLYGVKVEK